MTVAANDPGFEATFGEVTQWFFDDYLNRWTSVVNGTCQDGPEFILDYWGCPMHANSPRMNRWLAEPRDVTDLLAEMQARVRRAGQTEIERLAVHYEAVRSRDGWRVIGIQEIDTTAQSLDELWPIHRGQHRGSPTPQAGGIRPTGRLPS